MSRSYKGGAEVWLHLFLTSLLEEDDVQCTSRPLYLQLKNTPLSLNGPKGRSWMFGKRKFLVPPGNRTPDLSRRSLVTKPTTMSHIHKQCLGFDTSPFFKWLVVILTYVQAYAHVSLHISDTAEHHTRIILDHGLLVNTMKPLLFCQLYDNSVS